MRIQFENISIECDVVEFETIAQLFGPPELTARSTQALRDIVACAIAWKRDPRSDTQIALRKIVETYEASR